jgi:hypothetical protein
MLGRLSALGQIGGKSKNKVGEMLWLDEPVKGVNCSKRRTCANVIKVAERASSSRREIVKGKDLTPTFFSRHRRPSACPGPRLRLTDPRVGGQLEKVQFLFCRLKGRITDHVTCSKIDEGLPLRVN